MPPRVEPRGWTEMPGQGDYKLRLEIFEGPLDLLLYLIKKNEVDIYNIPIEKITAQYMEYLSLMRMLDLNIAGEFIVMAATLMVIKSRMLLPPEERPEGQQEEEEEDPRWDLVRQLVEYKKFKDAALLLQQKEIMQENVFLPLHRGIETAPEDTGLELHDVSLFDLISAFNEVLKRAKPEQIADIYADRWTVADKIDYLVSLLAVKSEVMFSSLFRPEASRSEIICTFLALLELMRLRQVEAFQADAFGEIVIRAAVGPAEQDAAGAEDRAERDAGPADAGSAGAGEVSGNGQDIGVAGT